MPTSSEPVLSPITSPSDYSIPIDSDNRKSSHARSYSLSSNVRLDLARCERGQAYPYDTLFPSSTPICEWVMFVLFHSDHTAWLLNVNWVGLAPQMLQSQIRHARQLADHCRSLQAAGQCCPELRLSGTNLGPSIKGHGCFHREPQ